MKTDIMTPSLSAIAQQAKVCVTQLYNMPRSDDDMQDQVGTLEDLASHCQATDSTEALYQVALSFKIVERLEACAETLDFTTHLKIRKLKRYLRSVRVFLEKNGAEPDRVYADSLMPV